MKIIIILLKKEAIMFSLPIPGLSDIDDFQLISALYNSNTAIEYKTKVKTDLSDQEKAAIQKQAQKDEGRDLISPIGIPIKYNGMNNLNSLRMMIENFKGLNSESVSVTEKKLDDKTEGFVISIK